MRKRLCILLVSVASLSQSLVAANLPRPKAKWTFMVYMNADSGDLDKSAHDDLLQMSGYRLMLWSAYGHKKLHAPEGNVQVVVQADRSGGGVSGAVVKDWSGARVFWIHPQMERGFLATLEELVDLGATNMGDGSTLQKFVAYAKRNFPATHYALVIWCHGQGWRPVEVEGEAAKKTELTSHPYKAASADDGDSLYNAEAAKAIEDVFHGEKLDLIAYDSCLMGMIETAYAWRTVADTFVASEELVPGGGFSFDTLLAALENRPDMTPSELGKLMVDDYGAAYTRSHDKTTTLSAVSLGKVDDLAKAVSALADELGRKLASQKEAIAAARRDCALYGKDNESHLIFYYVDLKHFCDNLAVRSSDAAVQRKAKAVTDCVTAAVAGRNYAGPDRVAGKYGSSGLAIYFPASKSEYATDRLTDEDYDPVVAVRHAYPVAFVIDRNVTWAKFLKDYYEVTP